MRQFNEAEHAREERRKYQKTVQTLTLFIISYIVQWLPSITYFIWSSITSPPDVSVSEFICTLNKKAFQLKDKCPLANGCFGLCFPFPTVPPGDSPTMCNPPHAPTLALSNRTLLPDEAAQSCSLWTPPTVNRHTVR